MTLGIAFPHVGEKYLTLCSWVRALSGLRYDIAEAGDAVVVHKKHESSHSTVEVGELGGLPQHLNPTLSVALKANDLEQGRESRWNLNDELRYQLRQV